MADDPFYAPNRAPAPQRTPKPGEKLFEFHGGHDGYLVELRDHGIYGVESQFFRNEEFSKTHRFKTRALAVQWAEEERVLQFGRVHQTLRVTPAMEAGIADHVCPVEEIIDLLNGR